jgi:hypothetical protein
MSIAYPADLPVFLREPYSVSGRSPVLENDFGQLVRRRQIYSSIRKEFDVSLLLSPTQEPIFRTFYFETLEMGSLVFGAPLLLEGVRETVDAKFIGLPPVFGLPNKFGYVRATARLLTA